MDPFSLLHPRLEISKRHAYLMQHNPQYREYFEAFKCLLESVVVPDSYRSGENIQREDTLKLGRDKSRLPEDYY